MVTSLLPTSAGVMLSLLCATWWCSLKSMNDAITGQSHLRPTLPPSDSGPQTPPLLLLVNLPYVSAIGTAQLLCSHNSMQFLGWDASGELLQQFRNGLQKDLMSFLKTVFVLKYRIKSNKNAPLSSSTQLLHLEWEGQALLSLSVCLSVSLFLPDQTNARVGLVYACDQAPTLRTGVFPAKEPVSGLGWTRVVQANNIVNVANQFIGLPVGP